jgi:hypothetical protein
MNESSKSKMLMSVHRHNQFVSTVTPLLTKIATAASLALERAALTPRKSIDFEDVHVGTADKSINKLSTSDVLSPYPAACLM